MSDWRKVTLNQMGHISRGRSKHRPRNDARLFGGPYPFIQTGDIGSAGLYVTGYNQTYNEDGLAQSKLWEKDTLCITIAANIADTALLAFPACFPDSIMGFTPFYDVANVKFVKYCFDVLQRDCKQISQGTAQDNLSWEKLSTILFPCPPIEVQNKIATILSRYDSLIENYQKQIKLLEESAQRLYKEWFIDLRFPGHENTKIVDGVPEGWEKKTLSDIATIIMGQSPKSEFYNSVRNGLPFHQGVGSYGFRFVVDNVYSTSFTRIAESNSILFSVRAPVGRLNITKNKIVIGRGLAAINHKKGHQSFLYYLLKEKFFKDNIIGNGAIFASISKDELYNQIFVIPSDEMVMRYDTIANKIDKDIQYIDSQIYFLTEGRDRLLPKLMSGEVIVKR